MIDHSRLAPRLLAALLSMLVWAVPSRAQNRAVSAEETKVREARIAQNHAMAAGDVELAATWWTDDVTIRRGLGAGLSGRNSYKDILSRAPVSDTTLMYERTTTDVSVSSKWPLAFETGTWVARGGGKGPALITGRYSAQWVSREGKWFIRSEVFVALTCTATGCDATAVP